jgi:type II secretory ATPase GspE/PulE/Tfp pilus assembly ATPase PilB-like protein
VGIYELLVMTDEVKDAVVRRAPRSELRAIAEQAGMRALHVDGWAKVEAGITTVEEVLRVVQS